MIGNNVENVQAYTEVICLLKHFPIEYIKKLPDKLIELMIKNSDEKYNIIINLNKGLKNQNISKKAKDILIVLNYNYWVDEKQKNYLKEQFLENEKNLNKDKLEMYDIDIIFKNKKNVKSEKKIEIELEKENELQSLLKEYKESFFYKLRNWIKKFLNKKR